MRRDSLNKLVCIPILLLLIITLIGFNVFDSNKDVPMEMVAFGSLKNKEKRLIPASPKDSIVKKVSVDGDIKSKIDVNYVKEEVYSVTFNHTLTDTSGNLVVYIALDKKTVVGKNFDGN